MEDIKNLDIRTLLSEGEYHIPIYQRNYAWGIPEITQLIQDIADYAKESPNSNYYIGNLIVFPVYKGSHLFFETIDGQQRTTSLTIILCALKNNLRNYDFEWYSRLNISFEHRENSNYTLRTIYENGDIRRLDHDLINTDINSVYNKAFGIIETICENKGISTSDFVDYLLSKVRILRICVPKDTDKNHYFEIMNSRGEQLEQHEIVKAWLMKPLRDNSDEMKAFDIIWEACSDMDRYVLLNFNSDFRHRIFDNDGTGNIQLTFNDISQLNTMTTATETDEKTLSEIFEDTEQYRKPWLENQEKEYPDTYNALITFPNFLLHVLKIMYKGDKSIALDDKRLSKTFKHAIEEKEEAGLSKEFSIDFIMQLLTLRLLFDKFIIKRKQEKWTLRKYYCNSENKKKTYYYKDTFSPKDTDEDKAGENRGIILLQSMFHVSFPTQIYKHWMNACLYYVYNNPDTTANDFKNYLWNLAKGYMLDRYLRVQNIKDFDDIIYKQDGLPANKIDSAAWNRINIDISSLQVNQIQNGEKVENFVFNFYDYLLLQKNNDADFEYTYRTSVEHFSPQHPIDKEPVSAEYLHNFGNLCLVSRSMNSKFSNNTPLGKYDAFGKREDRKAYSLKLKDMMECMENREEWNENKIIEKEQAAKELIFNALK